MHLELKSSHLFPLPTIKPTSQAIFRLKLSAKRWAILTALLLLASCASTPASAPIEARDVEEPSQTISGDQTTAYTEQNYEIQQAHYYSKQANNNTEALERIESRLSAAEFYIQANDIRNASRELSLLDQTLELGNQSQTQLSPQQRQRKQIISAYIDYQNGYAQSALSAVNELIDQDSFETLQLQVDALLLASFAHQSLNDYASAIAALIQREALLHGNARAETSRYIWQVINSMTEEQRYMVSASSDIPAVRNRIEQSMAGEVGGMTDQPTQFNRWRDADTKQRKQMVSASWTQHSPQRISVLLPSSSRFSKASQAVIDGIEHQHSLNQSAFRPQIDYFDLGQEPNFTPQYFQAAQQRGANLIIGPIGLSYANTLASYSRSSSSTPTILLGGDRDLSNGQHRLTLSPSREANHIANHAMALGYVNAAILMPETTHGQRLAQAFNQAWLARGGKVSKTVPYSSAQFDHSTELKMMFDLNQSHQRHKKVSDVLGFKPEFAPYRRKDIDFIFMIADAKAGRILRPQINFFGGNSIPVIAPSGIYDGTPNRNENLDLDNTIFPIMPWMMASKNKSIYAGQLRMLFALGADAYRLAPTLTQLERDPAFAINGNSGQLHREPSGEIIATPIWAKFNNGEAESEPLDPILIEEAQLSPALKQSMESTESSSSNQRPRKEYNDSNWDHRQ